MIITSYREEVFIMANIKKNITELIGNTPMMELSRYGKEAGVKARIIAKLEAFNPGSSIKDRIGFAMLKDAEEKGLIKKGSLIVEPTSGNTGIGLALAACASGFRLILTMPETMSLERRKLLQALGAEIVLTEGSKGMSGAVAKAEQIISENPGAYMPQQFKNPVNPEIHRNTTAQEILRDTDRSIDAFVAGVGTGGTITGVGEILKAELPDIKVFAVEPYDSPLLSGGKAGSHKIQGIGANFIPETLNIKVIDEVIPVKNEEAFEKARILAKTEGFLGGISCGAALHAATVVGKRPEFVGKTIVVIFPDSGERYLSTELF